jgi:hypothetical protein
MVMLTDEFLKELDEALKYDDKCYDHAKCNKSIAKAARILQSIAPHLNEMVGVRDSFTEALVMEGFYHRALAYQTAAIAKILKGEK